MGMTAFGSCYHYILTSGEGCRFVSVSVLFHKPLDFFPALQGCWWIDKFSVQPGHLSLFKSFLEQIIAHFVLRFVLVSDPPAVLAL